MRALTSDHHRRRPVASSAVLLTVALLGVGVVAGNGRAAAETPTASAAQVTWGASSARPFSDPKWLPLRRTAAVSCTYQNCLTTDGNHYHGYWALDLLGRKGDPVHAAGAGIFHIGARDTGCKSTDSPDSPGTWVWIDHGAGIVSRYHHLDTISSGLADGSLVTPSTQIGTMGSTGDFAPCTTNYLHFEVRKNGVKGTRVDPGQLWGCEGTTRHSYPAAFGYQSWNDVPKVSEWTPELDEGCLPSSTGTSTAPASVNAARGNALARLSWTAPSAGASTVKSYVVSQELWAPSLGAWHAPVYRTLDAVQLATTVTGLENGRRYRFRVLARNAIGSSAWTDFREVTPATVPSIPATDRGLSASFDQVRFAWWKSAAQGTPVTSYTVAIRRQTSTGWTAWSYARVPADVFSHKFDGLRPRTTYQVTVRADSNVGSSRYGISRSVTTAAG